MSVVLSEELLSITNMSVLYSEEITLFRHFSIQGIKLYDTIIVKILLMPIYFCTFIVLVNSDASIIYFNLLMILFS